uniref:E3 ubiquitin protein ligase n=1 Tax=Zonotrichia albicollis TaxID=44394 RepID=A0A8D2MT76_ZONAL
MEAWIWEDKGEGGEEDSWLRTLTFVFLVISLAVPCQICSCSGSAPLQFQSSAEDTKEKPAEIKQEREREREQEKEKEKEKENEKKKKEKEQEFWPEPVILLQEEVALLSEMDQNIQCIKFNQIHKLLKEEREELAEEVLTLKTQMDAQLQVDQKLEEREHLLQSSIGTGERELGLQTQALEMNKHKVSEAFLSSWAVRGSLGSSQMNWGESFYSKDKQKEI